MRARVLRRDRHRCRRCGSDEHLEVHHVNGKRGDNRPINLLTLCRDCHRIVDRALGIWR